MPEININGFNQLMDSVKKDKEPKDYVPEERNDNSFLDQPLASSENEFDISKKTAEEKRLEKLEKLKIKESQAKEKRKEYEAKIRSAAKSKERKVRTKRLIDLGAIAEHYAGAELDVDKWDSFWRQHSDVLADLVKIEESQDFYEQTKPRGMMLDEEV